MTKQYFQATLLILPTYEQNLYLDIPLYRVILNDMLERRGGTASLYFAVCTSPSTFLACASICIMPQMHKVACLPYIRHRTKHYQRYFSLLL